MLTFDFFMLIFELEPLAMSDLYLCHARQMAQVGSTLPGSCDGGSVSRTVPAARWLNLSLTVRPEIVGHGQSCSSLGHHGSPKTWRNWDEDHLPS